VVIGYDGRYLSKEFAEDSGGLRRRGARSAAAPRLLPTPLLAFAVLHLGRKLGVCYRIA